MTKFKTPPTCYDMIQGHNELPEEENETWHWRCRGSKCDETCALSVHHDGAQKQCGRTAPTGSAPGTRNYWTTLHQLGHATILERWHSQGSKCDMHASIAPPRCTKAMWWRRARSGSRTQDRGRIRHSLHQLTHTIIKKKNGALCGIRVWAYHLGRCDLTEYHSNSNDCPYSRKYISRAVVSAGKAPTILLLLPGQWNVVMPKYLKEKLHTTARWRVHTV